MIAMPADANPSGDIFGGWIMSLMDMAGGQVAFQYAGGRIVTVAVDEIVFHVPVAVGDEVSCYADVVRTGRTSVRTHVEVWTRRRAGGPRFKVTEGDYTYVLVDQGGRPRPLADGLQQRGRNGKGTSDNK
jgi:acyl-CoA thioesterase YciA